MHYRVGFVFRVKKPCQSQRWKARGNYTFADAGRRCGIVAIFLDSPLAL